MSLKEKFEALMKSYQSISSSNQELKNQNEYLKQQLREAMKQTKKHSILLLILAKEMRVRLIVIILNQQVKKMFQECQDMREDRLNIQVILELIFQNSRASSILKNSLTSLAQLSEFLNTRTCLKTRK